MRAAHLDRSSCAAAGSVSGRPRQSGSRAGGDDEDGGGGVRCCLVGGSRCRKSATS